jgi:hypothetical protein
MTGDTDRRQGIAFIVAMDPIAIIIAGTREADHFPAGHITIAAIDRIGEKTFAGILQDDFEERRRAGAIECDRSLFKRGARVGNYSLSFGK